MTQKTILLTGSHGFIGQAYRTYLQHEGYHVISLVRSPTTAEDEHYWTPNQPDTSPPLPAADAIIHLAAPNIAARRWTPAYKRYMLQTRQQTLMSLHHLIKGMSQPPSVMLVASAVGYVGYQHSTPTDESFSKGTGFAADMCDTIESTLPDMPDTRVAYIRFGIVLGKGGPLGKLLPFFKRGLGTQFGDGSQPFPWISLEDTCRALTFILENEALHGPINIAAPHQDTHKTFVTSLAQTLKKPLFLKIPTFFVRLLLGDMGKEVLLHGVAAQPQKLLKQGFVFKDTTLDRAFRRIFTHQTSTPSS